LPGTVCQNNFYLFIIIITDQTTLSNGIRVCTERIEGKIAK
jgi:hypothetical protein